jgi:hypothetical protein
MFPKLLDVSPNYRSSFQRSPRSFYVHVQEGPVLSDYRLSSKNSSRVHCDLNFIRKRSQMVTLDERAWAAQSLRASQKFPVCLIHASDTEYSYESNRSVVMSVDSVETPHQGAL